ncbi:hypothetical protein C6P40_002458 [Pichia californica]|uniref:Uncharacterized protein n=1 Tax=Pichia californica TaxID=460514 RepID=A0A9P6WIE6_9ASCO|nr:hypothetical protein C6P42_001463 [[Candida] californica]KAG0687359.1 hypothetical protein C6P40_002458 [[Candida] californica]
MTGEEHSKTIIVTGASQGLGHCIVRNILNDYSNANVVLIARNHALLTGFYNGLSENDKLRVLIIKGDVTNKDLIISAINQTILKFGKIDGIIFNAGMIEPVGHLNEIDYSIEKMKNLFDLNYFSIVMFINELLIRIDKNQSINFIFVSSGASKRGIDGWLAYGSSKAALNQLCKQIHDEMYPRIKCVSIAPGVVNTDMQREIRENLIGKMESKSHDNFINLYKNGELLDGMVVGKVYSRLIVEGIEPASDICGEYIRWNDSRL